MHGSSTLILQPHDATHTQKAPTCTTHLTHIRNNQHKNKHTNPHTSTPPLSYANSPLHEPTTLSHPALPQTTQLLTSTNHIATLNYTSTCKQGMLRAGDGGSPGCHAAGPDPTGILPNHKNCPKTPIYTGETDTPHLEAATSTTPKLHRNGGRHSARTSPLLEQ